MLLKLSFVALYLFFGYNYWRGVEIITNFNPLKYPKGAVYLARFFMTLCWPLWFIMTIADHLGKW